MRNLSSTLKAAQRSASIDPYVKVEIVERLGGIARLTWDRIYNGNGEDDYFHACWAGYIASPPSHVGDFLYRIKSDADTNVITQQVVEISDSMSGFDSWSSPNPSGTETGYAVAATGHADYIRYMRMAYVATDGHIYINRFGGGSWMDLGNVSGDATFRLAMAFADGTHQIILYSDDADIYVCEWVSGSGYGSLTKWTNASLNSITGIAVVYAGDYNVIITGEDSNGDAGVWQCIYGDGYSAAAGTWTSLQEIIIARSGSNVTFHHPSIAYPDVFRLFYVEAYSGTESYSRPYYTYSLPSTDFISNLWREPVPFNLDSDYGLALCYYGSDAFLTRPDAVYRAGLTPNSIEVTDDVVEVREHVHPDGGGVLVLLDNSNGQYNDIGSAASEDSYKAIEKGCEVRLSFGAHTSAGDETGGLEPVCWITSIEHQVKGGQARLAITAENSFSLLARWKARRQFSWAAGDKNYYQLLAWIFAKVGLELGSFSTSTAIVNQYPPFTINPSNTGLAAVRRLLDRLPDVLLFIGDCGYTKHLKASDSSNYSYGDPNDNFHAILDGSFTSSIPAINRAQVQGASDFTEDHDWTAIDLYYDTLQFDEDVYLANTTRCHERGDAMLRKAEIFAPLGHITVPMNCGQDLFDVIKVTSPQAGLSAALRRVIGITRHYLPAKGIYICRLELGAR